MRRRRRALTGARGPNTLDAPEEVPAPDASEPEPGAPETHFKEGVELLHAALGQLRGEDATETEHEQPGRTRRERNGGNGPVAEVVATADDVDESEGVEDAEELDREPDDPEARRRERAEQRKRRAARGARRREGWSEPAAVTTATAETAPQQADDASAQA
ncbi:MAG TPA: hypothetical protein VF152_05955, partial [Acidimicrobiia bacterium]